MVEALGKILVIRGGAIGDFILTLPVLTALRRQFPLAPLEVLGYPHIVQLALAGGLADQVRSIEARALAGFFAARSPLDQDLANYFGSFSLILSYLYDPDTIFRVNVARCSKAQFIVGPHRPSDTLDLHATEVFLQPLERLAIFSADPIPRLRLDSRRASTMPLADTHPHDAPGGTPCLALHPGSGSERKNWPEEKWAEFLRGLAVATDLKFLLVGGEAEGDRLNRLSAALPKDRTQRAQNLPLLELAVRLQQCRAFVGHDSGISHLAAALGLDGLILWGNTNCSVWGPRSERMGILRTDGRLDRLPAKQVMEELLALLKKA